MKLNESVLAMVRGVGGAAVIAAMSAGCATGPAAQSQAPTRNAATVAAREAPPKARQSTQPGQNAQNRQNAQRPPDTQSEPTWTEDEMMAACGRG